MPESGGAVGWLTQTVRSLFGISKVADHAAAENNSAAASILFEAQVVESTMWGDISMTDLRDRIGYQPQLVDVLPNEKYPLFVAKSDVAEEINPGVMELGCFSACIIPEKAYFATYDGKVMDNYDFKSAVTENEMQFYIISYTDQSSEYSVTINGFDYETGRGFCYMAYANDGLTKREANCRIEYDKDLNKFKFFALKTIQPWEELLWSYDDSGVWWFERREVLPKLVYQEAVNKYLKHTRKNVAQGLDSPSSFSDAYSNIADADVSNNRMHAGTNASEENTYSIDSSTTKDNISSVNKESKLGTSSNANNADAFMPESLPKSKKVSASEVDINCDFKYNKPIFPRSYYANDVLIEYETNIDIRVIEEGIEILQSRYAFEIGSMEDNLPDINGEVVYYYVYQVSQIIEEALKLENKSARTKSAYKDLTSSGIETFLENVKLLQLNFQNFTNHITTAQNYLLFRNKQSDLETRYCSEKYDLRFNIIDSDIDVIWKYLNRLRWPDLISLDSNYPSGPHYISRLTCVRILYNIRKHFKYIYEFRNFADIGVGIPYLAACVKSFYNHVNVCGVDLKEIIDAITNKLSVIKKEDSVLGEIAFRECNILHAHHARYHDLGNYLKVCEMITNLIGLIDANEAIIKNVLPKSKCGMIMFRTKNIEFPKLHHRWLTKMGYKLFPVQLKGTLALQVLSILIILINNEIYLL